MNEPRFTPYDHEQMFVEVKVAYRLSELGGLLEPDSYDNSELEEIDAEYDQWLMKIKAEAWAEGYRAGNTRMNTYPPTEPTNPYRGDT